MRFTSVRDPFCDDASAYPPNAAGFTSDATGKVAYQMVLAPLGITGVTGTSPSGGGPITWSFSQTQAPKLPWLWNQSRGFERYRILRATAIFVGNVGQNVTGRVGITSSTDLNDSLLSNFGQTTGGKVWDLASSGSKELRFAVDVDSSWKRVANSTALYTGTTLLPVSTANDSLFSIVNLLVNGAPANTLVGNLFFEYDVEFRDPANITMNG